MCADSQRAAQTRTRLPSALLIHTQKCCMAPRSGRLCPRVARLRQVRYRFLSDLGSVHPWRRLQRVSARLAPLSCTWRRITHAPRLLCAISSRTWSGRSRWAKSAYFRSSGPRQPRSAAPRSLSTSTGARRGWAGRFSRLPPWPRRRVSSAFSRVACCKRHDADRPKFGSAEKQAVKNQNDLTGDWAAAVGLIS